MLIAISCLSGYYGNDMWLTELDIGFGKINLKKCVLIFGIVLEVFYYSYSVVSNIVYGRNTQRFKEAFTSKKSFFCHVSFMIALWCVYMSYSLI